MGGDFIGGILLKNLDKNRVNRDYVKIDKNSNTNIAQILVNSKGRNMIAVGPRADSKVSKKDVENSLEIIKDSDVLLTQLEIPISKVEYALKKAKSFGVNVILNPASATLSPKTLMKYIDILTPNEVELETLTGLKINSLDLKEFEKVKGFNRFWVKTVIVTLGGRGALVVDEKEVYRVKGIKVHVTDTTGAWDAFNAALAVSLTEGKGIMEAVKIANFVVALATSKVDAQEDLSTRKAALWLNYCCVFALCF
ncbi:MAG: ribokinase [Nitrososphaerales archaeon]